jgi:hypothetical protein
MEISCTRGHPPIVMATAGYGGVSVEMEFAP